MEYLNFWVSLLSALSIVFLALQVFLMKRQIKNAHEEKRREKTVDLMLSWSKSLKKDASFAEKIVESFDEKQCRALLSKKY